MRKLFNLLAAGTLAGTLGMTACSDDSSASAPAGDEPQSSAIQDMETSSSTIQAPEALSSIQEVSSSSQKTSSDSQVVSSSSQDTATSSSSTITKANGFTVSGCKTGALSKAASISDFVTTDPPLPEFPTATLIANADGTYKIEIADVKESCEFNANNSNITKAMNDDYLMVSTNYNGPLVDCICDFDMSFDITAEQAKATSLLLNGTEYRIVTEKKGLAKTNEYGMALGECKDVDIDTLAKKVAIDDIAISNTADSLSYAVEPRIYAATLITEGAITQVMIPDVLDACDIEATIKVSMNEGTILIEYDKIMSSSKCICVKDHWIDISSIGSENIAKATQVEFLDRVFLLSH